MSRHAGKAERIIRARQPKQLASYDQSHKQVRDAVDGALFKLKREIEAALDRLEGLNYEGGQLLAVDPPGEEVAVWQLGSGTVQLTYLDSSERLLRQDLYAKSYVHVTTAMLRDEALAVFEKQFADQMDDKLLNRCLEGITYYIWLVRDLGL